MTEMSAAEAATVARFEAAEPAPESWGGLRGLLSNEIRRRWVLRGDANADRFADALLPVVTAWHEEQTAVLRAKAAAADRVRELADECEVIGNDRKAGVVKRSLNRAVAGRVLRALDGPDRTDRGRC